MLRWHQKIILSFSLVPSQCECIMVCMYLYYGVYVHVLWCVCTCAMVCMYMYYGVYVHVLWCVCTCTMVIMCCNSEMLTKAIHIKHLLQ